MSVDELHAAINDAPPDLRAWLQTQPSLESAWANCDRADWLFWLARRHPADDLQQRRIVGAAALTIRMSDAPPVPARELRLATAWSSGDFSDPDPTGFRATILALVLAGAVGIALELWLCFRSTSPIRGLQRELYSVPTFLVLAVVIRLVARPLLARRWVSAIRGYSFERAERCVFPWLAEVVARADAKERASQADTFRKRMAWSR
jgi:hypothetical protein